MWLVKDCCGFILAFLTWNLIIYADFVVIYVLLWHQIWTFTTFITFLAFQTTLGLAIISHLKSMLTDPGTIRLKLLPVKKGADLSQQQYYIFDQLENDNNQKYDAYDNQVKSVSRDCANEKLSLINESCDSDPDYLTKQNSSYNINNKNYSYINAVNCNLIDSDDSDGPVQPLLRVPLNGNKSLTRNEGPHHVYQYESEKGASESINLITHRPILRCLKCFSLKPDRAHHCSTCKKCINKMDHHCPWINNCVGENNQKFFVLFNFYILLSGAQALYLCAHHIYTCVQSDWMICSKAFDAPTSFLLIIFLIFESLLFTIFCCIMTGMQIHRILTDTTAIEALKRTTATKFNEPTNCDSDIKILFENGNDKTKNLSADIENGIQPYSNNRNRKNKFVQNFPSVAKCYALSHFFLHRMTTHYPRKFLHNSGMFVRRRGCFKNFGTCNNNNTKMLNYCNLPTNFMTLNDSNFDVNNYANMTTGRKGTIVANIREVFGEDMSPLLWFSPFHNPKFNVLNYFEEQHITPYYPQDLDSRLMYNNVNNDTYKNLINTNDICEKEMNTVKTLDSQYNDTSFIA